LRLVQERLRVRLLWLYLLLSSLASSYVLKQVLSGEPTEGVVEAIHEYLTTVGEGVRGGKVSLDDFIIWKRLGKNPQDYPDAKSLPHVQVALRQKQRGQDVKAGDVVPYVFCLGEDGIGSTRTAQADRAHHPDELRRPDSNLKIGAFTVFAQLPG
jgi:DNA polymerase alpha subunit A